jgi:hypothetical protein
MFDHTCWSLPLALIDSAVPLSLALRASFLQASSKQQQKEREQQYMQSAGRCS